jgi:transposase
MTDKREYQRYSPEFKREAVRQLTDSDKSCTQLARELGIRVNQLYKWKQQLDQKQDHAFPGSGRQAEPESEVAQLKRGRLGSGLAFCPLLARLFDGLTRRLGSGLAFCPLLARLFDGLMHDQS